MMWRPASETGEGCAEGKESLALPCKREQGSEASGTWKLVMIQVSVGKKNGMNESGPSRPIFCSLSCPVQPLCQCRGCSEPAGGCWVPSVMAVAPIRAGWPGKRLQYPHLFQQSPVTSMAGSARAISLHSSHLPNPITTRLISISPEEGESDSLFSNACGSFIFSGFLG